MDADNEFGSSCPTSALPLYQQAEGWKDLWNLKGGAETVTGIENVTVPSKDKKSCIYASTE